MRFLRAHTEIYSQMASGRPLISNPVPIELLPYLQNVAITETKGSLDELVTFNYMYANYFKYRTFLKKRFMLNIISYS
jgi:hypothetical protein